MRFECFPGARSPRRIARYGALVAMTVAVSACVRPAVDDASSIDATNPIGFDAAVADGRVALGLGNNEVLAMAANGTTRRLFVSTQVGPAVAWNYSGPDAGDQNPLPIAVIDETNGSTVATVPPPVVYGRPRIVTEMAVDESANRVYMIGTEEFVWILDGATNTLLPTSLSTAGTGDFGGPTALGLDPDLHRLYVGVRSNVGDQQSVMVFDTMSLERIATVLVPSNFAAPRSIAVDTTQHRLYACMQFNVATIDTTTNTLIGSLRTWSQENGGLSRCQGGAGTSNVIFGQWVPGTGEQFTMFDVDTLLSGGAGEVTPAPWRGFAVRPSADGLTVLGLRARTNFFGSTEGVDPNADTLEIANARVAGPPVAPRALLPLVAESSGIQQAAFSFTGPNAGTVAYSSYRELRSDAGTVPLEAGWMPPPREWSIGIVDFTF